MERVRERWEYRVASSSTKEVYPVLSSGVARSSMLEALETMFGRHSKEPEGYGWNGYEGRWMYPGEGLVKVYKEDPSGRDVRESQERGAKELARLAELQAEGKVVEDDVWEFKVS